MAYGGQKKRYERIGGVLLGLVDRQLSHGNRVLDHFLRRGLDHDVARIGHLAPAVDDDGHGGQGLLDDLAALVEDRAHAGVGRAGNDKVTWAQSPPLN